jgi:hypothetical protein
MGDIAYDRCALCGGTREEHNEVTKHIFSTTPGDLRVKPAVSERQSMKEPDAAIDVVLKLIEVLTEKEVITIQEAFSCFGMKQTLPKESPDARNDP